MTKKTNEIDKIIGEKIYNYRAVKGLSRKQLADAIGITHQQIHKYEKGINRITVSRLNDICEYLSVNMAALLDTEGLKPPVIEKNKKLVNDIMAHISAITDEGKLRAIKNLVKSI